VRIGLGTSSGIGVEDDTFKFKAGGCGLYIGRKIKISIFDN